MLHVVLQVPRCYYYYYFLLLLLIIIIETPQQPPRLPNNESESIIGITIIMLYSSKPINVLNVC